jgi:hypothetical protein
MLIKSTPNDSLTGLSPGKRAPEAFPVVYTLMMSLTND